MYWNDYRRQWVMIAVETGGTSFLGEVWYAEADALTGPWSDAVKVVTHDRYSFYNPKQHPEFAKDNGRVIYFEGTYSQTFSGNPTPTPRYDYNQVMYKLDLTDPRLALPARGANDVSAWFRISVRSCPGPAPLDVAEARAADTWRAGAAAITITPDKPMWLSGYADRSKPAEGKAQRPARQGAGHWKTRPAGGPWSSRWTWSASLVTSRRPSATNWNGSTIAAGGDLVSCSHTHSGPVVRGNLMAMYSLDDAQLRLVNEYAAGLKAKLVDVVGTAIADLAPADSRGRGYVTFAVNRRTIRKTALPSAGALGRLKGPVDHDVPVLAVRAKDGKLRAVLFGYACHATVLSGYQWSRGLSRLRARRPSSKPIPARWHCSSPAAAATRIRCRGGLRQWPRLRQGTGPRRQRRAQGPDGPDHRPAGNELRRRSTYRSPNCRRAKN